MKPSSTTPQPTPEGITTQAKLVLDYLKAGRSLTPMIAMMSLGVGSLTARIAELRSAGVFISDEWSKDHFKRRYKTYWLGEEKPFNAPATDAS